MNQQTTKHKVTSLTEEQYQQQMLLVTRVKNNDVAAYEQLYREHVGRVYALCLRMVNNNAIAEELCQEVFVKVWQKIHSFRGDSAFSSWLHRLATNLVLSDLRKKQLLTMDIDDVSEAQVQSNTDTDTGKVLDMEQAVRQLPDGARAIFVLHDVEGFQHKEIAEMLSIAEGTSKTQLHRARKLLKGWLQ